MIHRGDRRRLYLCRWLLESRPTVSSSSSDRLKQNSIALFSSKIVERVQQNSKGELVIRARIIVWDESSNGKEICN